MNILDKIEYLNKHKINVEIKDSIPYIEEMDAENLMTDESEILNKLKEIENFYKATHKKSIFIFDYSQLNIISYSTLKRIIKICDKIIIFNQGGII